MPTYFDPNSIVGAFVSEDINHRQFFKLLLKGGHSLVFYSKAEQVEEYIRKRVIEEVE
jgi:hypothetical protein